MTDEIQRISEQTGIAVSEVKAAIEELKKQGLTDTGALAVSKSQKRNLLGGKMADVVARVLMVESPREVQKGSEMLRIASVHLLAAADGKFNPEENPKQTSLWNENADLANGLSPNQVISFKGKIMGDGLDVRLMDKSINPSTVQLPTTKELIQAIASVKNITLAHAIADVAGIRKVKRDVATVGKYALVKGTVGRIISAGASNSRGIEISAEDVDPLTVWLDDDTPANLGSDVIIYGFISEKGGQYKMRGRIVA